MRPYTLRSTPTENWLVREIRARCPSVASIHTLTLPETGELAVLAYRARYCWFERPAERLDRRWSLADLEGQDSAWPLFRDFIETINITWGRPRICFRIGTRTQMTTDPMDPDVWVSRIRGPRRFSH